MRDLFGVDDPHVWPPEVEAARMLGRMYAMPPLKRFLVTSPAARQAKTGADLAIAAIAISQQAVVVTNNVADFLAIQRHFPLPGLLNPFTCEWLVPPVGPGD